MKNDYIDLMKGENPVIITGKQMENNENSGNPDSNNDLKIKKEKRKSKFTETIETVIIALILAIFIRATVAEARYIPSESMVPTLLIKDRLVVEKISNYTGKPTRGEVLVFYPRGGGPIQRPIVDSGTPPRLKEFSPANPFEVDNGNNETFTSEALTWLGFTNKVAYIKRVIGLPGETIEVKQGTVFIDGKPLDESAYIKEKPYYDMEAIKLNSDEIFMMGDNRNNSSDSHVWGPLPEKNIIGHAVLRFWPLTRIGTIN
jgi:signal peptidase I